MDALDERDDMTDDDVVAHRARAKAQLLHIAQQAKRALHEGSIDLDLFFMIPSNGDSILTFGTAGDPNDDEWGRVGEIVSSIVRKTVGLDYTRCREVVCLTTTTTDDLRQPAGADGAVSQ
jgi:hypothetical protein